ncbi:MAG: DMSO reductase iron-sulfur subunit [Flavobacteriales bacterium]|jgi:DMSO reductase iron-sulfur subunit
MSQNLNQDSAVQGFDPSNASVGKEQEGRSNHWEVRTEEQDYAFLPDQEIKESNRYGQLIDLVDLTGQEKDRSMHINDNPDVGSNPNRNKQHGFFFTADNCIGCHACEAACSEKNENPAHIAFRSVGYVEGGSYPDYKRMNISMACNHCDDPVCLKGCPTRAYTKHVEYGAVLQDPETCFGCGYCTWVCPYNAPQLDPVKGQVTKCNMCVDRLEVGLKPSCVSACVGNALDFGVIENTPENREQCLTEIPGFPTADITQPNIRFQQTRNMPIEMSRTDSMPVKYHRDESGSYKPVVDQKLGKEKHWNFSRLNSRENPLVLFTVSCQAAYGLFLIPFLASLFGLEPFGTFVQSDMFLPLTALAAAMTGFGLLMSVTHLGKPLRFYRGFNNLRYSPMCREGLGLSLFATGCALAVLFLVPSNSIISGLINTWFGLDLQGLSSQALVNSAGIFALLGGLGGLYYMYRCYRIKARPFWDHWQTACTFAGNTLSIGALIGAAIVIPTLAIQESTITGAAIELASLVFALSFIAGLALEGLGLTTHNRDMNKAEHEGAASHYVQCTTFGKTYIFRNWLLGLNLVASTALLALMLTTEINLIVLLLWACLGCLNVFTALIGRALFYILVIPTTMPGAFFWKNKGFEDHARDIGLANNPATGVAPLGH